jgi:RecB family exonuclease
VFLRGKIDLAMYVAKNNTAIIVDHKTGNVKKINEDYELQLLSYLFLFYFSFLCKFDPKPSPPNGVLFINALGGNVPDILKGPELKSDQFEESVQNAMVKKINEASEKAETNQAIPGHHCKYCNYVEICPAGVKL